MIVRALFLISGLLIVTMVTSAQTPDQLRKQRESELEVARSNRELAIRQLEEDFNDYRSKQDKDFSDYLKAKWEAFDVFKAERMPAEPKPDKAPEFDPEALDVDFEIIDIEPEPKGPEPDIPTIDPSADLKKIPQPDRDPEDIVQPAMVSFWFFGEQIELSVDPQIEAPFANKINEESFAQYYDSITSSYHQDLVNQLIEHKARLKLNDWGYYMFTHALTKNIHANDEISANMLNWILLLKSGFQVKLAYASDDICLLLPSEQQIYENNYTVLDGARYYLSKNINSTIYTYQQDHEGSDRILNSRFNKALELPIDIEERQLEFKYGEKLHKVAIQYNKNTVDFYNQYPVLEISHYFNSAVSDLTKASIKSQFSEILDGYSAEEKGNILLSFIHQAFPYKTDDDQFGKEKYFYVEDVFSYPYCDCEDRSVLYAFLIKNMVGTEVIGIDAPGHVFTAVQFSDEPIGDYIKYNNSIMTVCDPTYIGARVGNGMPDMMREQLIAIPIDLSTY